MSLDPTMLAAIDKIYAAATDESLWSEVMVELLGITDSRGATFCIIDGSDQPRLPVLTYVNFEPAFVAEYLQGMVVHDPTVQYIVAHPHQKLIHDAEFITEREKDRHFYYDWHERFSDTRHRLAAMAAPAPKIQSGVTLHRTKGQGDFHPVHIERFQFLLPHLERAVRIGFRLGTFGAMQQVSLQLLDSNPLAIVVLDDHGRVLFANRAAQTLAAAQDGVRLSSAGISLHRQSEDARLKHLIGEALGPQEKTAHASTGIMQAFRPSGRRPFSILVSPLSRGSFRLTAACPAACVVIADLERQHLLSEDALRRFYGLTTSEVRLAARLAGGESLQSAAAALTIQYATARTQLAAIFRKTHTTRQSELIRLLLSEVRLS